MTGRKVRFALVGTGGIAQSYAQAFEDHPEARLVAVADVRADAARALSERFNCPSYTSYKAMANEGSRFEAVIICTPPNTHEEISLYFLERKIHVLCEKPLCLNVAGARQHGAGRSEGRRQAVDGFKVPLRRRRDPGQEHRHLGNPRRTHPL